MRHVLIPTDDGGSDSPPETARSWVVKFHRGIIMTQEIKGSGGAKAHWDIISDAEVVTLTGGTWPPTIASTGR